MRMTECALRARPERPLLTGRRPRASHARAVSSSPPVVWTPALRAPLAPLHSSVVKRRARIALLVNSHLAPLRSARTARAARFQQLSPAPAARRARRARSRSRATPRARRARPASSLPFLARLSATHTRTVPLPTAKKLARTRWPVCNSWPARRPLTLCAALQDRPAALVMRVSSPLLARAHRSRSAVQRSTR
jgi:hypothetical protein